MQVAPFALGDKCILDQLMLGHSMDCDSKCMTGSLSPTGSQFRFIMRSRVAYYTEIVVKGLIHYYLSQGVF